MTPTNSKTVHALQRRHNDTTEHGINVQFVLNTLRHWWKIVLPAGLLLAAAGSAAVYRSFQRQYEAVAWLRIDEKPTHLSYESGYEDRTQGFANTQIELLRSPPVLQPLTREAELAAFFHEVAPRDPLAWLAKRLTVKSVGQSELYKVSIATPNGNLSA